MHPGLIADRIPDKAAYIMAGSGLRVSYRELEAASNQGAHLFRQLGLQVGDGIAILLENHPMFLQICWAAQRAGLYYTAISFRLQREEVEYIVRDCQAKVFITSIACAGLASQLADTLPNDVTCLMLDGEVTGFERWEEHTSTLPQTAIADQTEGMDMLYSSGTTGRPKGIRIALSGKPLGSMDQRARSLMDQYGMGEDTVYLSPAPLYHSAPLRYNMNLLRMGGTAIIMEHFDAEQALELIEYYRVTHSQWVPTMFIRLLKLPPEQRLAADLSSMQAAIHAAAPCPVQIKEQMINWWGPIIHEFYGGTEGNGLTGLNSREWLEHKGSVGRATKGILHIVDDTGQELGPRQVGNVYFEAGGEFEYFGDPDKTEASRLPSGWSTIGDMGYLDDDGYLYLTDRKSFMIISGGVNIYPQETEDVLIAHPAVVDVAVFGIPNAEFGEEVKAVVQPISMAEAGPALAADLIDFCRSRLAHLKCPRSVDFVAALPRHPTGKLYKRLLRDPYWRKD